jgi:hypothetical protein
VNASLLDWLLERIGVVIFVVIFVVQIVRGLMRSRTGAPEEEAKRDVLAEERRVREIQENIRRRIAERSGGAPAAEPPPLMRQEVGPPPRPNPETTQMPEPFGGPLRRVFEELERQANPPPEPPPRPYVPPVAATTVESRNAEVVRQEQLAEEIRVLEEARMLAKRRASRVAAGELAASNSELGQRSAARGRALDDLRDPESLRRAIVLREVLGTPVGLR